MSSQGSSGLKTLREQPCDTDEATAKNGERTGFKEMWADVGKHRFDLLLFWSLDRLTREGTYKTLTYLRRLTDAGVKFKSYTEQHIDSLGIFCEAIIGVLAAVAAQERIRISERTKAGLARTRRPPIRRRGPSQVAQTPRARRDDAVDCAEAPSKPGAHLSITQSGEGPRASEGKIDFAAGQSVKEQLLKKLIRSDRPPRRKIGTPPMGNQRSRTIPGTC